MVRQRLESLLHLTGVAVSAVLIVWWWSTPPDRFWFVVVTIVLVGGVLSAVHHVEVVADYVGRVWGAIILALAVTIIEVALIVSIMLASPQSAATLGRDTVFAAVMITTNGIIGVAVFAATLRAPTSSFNSEGSGAALGAIATIATLSLVLPTFTRSTEGPTLTSPQLVFVALVSLGIYAMFLYVLTVRNREHFEDTEHPGGAVAHHVPSRRQFVESFIFLMLALASVIGLAKVMSPGIEGAVREANLPISFVAVVIALVILLPEGIAAVRFARAGNLQSSFNLGYGSALASIGLTVPALAIVSLTTDTTLLLGLGMSEIVLLLLTLMVSTVTVSSHRTTLFQGGLHIVIFAAFLFLSVSP